MLSTVINKGPVKSHRVFNWDENYVVKYERFYFENSFFKTDLDSDAIISQNNLNPFLKIVAISDVALR